MSSKLGRNISVEANKAETKNSSTAKSRWFNTTIGEFVEAVYDAAMEEYMDELIARRIAMQMLLRKLRLQHKLKEAMEENRLSRDLGQQNQPKRAILRSELNKKRTK